MGIRPDQKLYRATEKAKAARREYDQKRRRRTEVIASERARAERRRLSDGGATNKKRVQATRDALCRSYVVHMMLQNTALTPGDVPDSLVELKRSQLSIDREVRKATHEDR